MKFNRFTSYRIYAHEWIRIERVADDTTLYHRDKSRVYHSDGEGGEKGGNGLVPDECFRGTLSLFGGDLYTSRRSGTTFTFCARYRRNLIGGEVAAKFPTDAWVVVDHVVGDRDRAVRFIYEKKCLPHQHFKFERWNRTIINILTIIYCRIHWNCCVFIEIIRLENSRYSTQSWYINKLF